MNNTAIILGTRGSIPVSGPAFHRYGGATTCFLFRLNGQSVLVDAGTGLLGLPAAELAAPALPLLLTHPHADHLLGLPMCPYAALAGRRLDIYGAARGGLDVQAQVRRLVSPPLWPVGPEHLAADLRFHDMPPSLHLAAGDILVYTLEGVHPGGVSLLRIERGGQSVAVVTDCTLTEALFPKAAAFARDCDLLLCDGQYSRTEWPAVSGFGHSTWTAAAELGQACGAKQVRVVHHAPWRTDADLDRAAEELAQIHPRCTFAREGEEIAL